MINQSYISQTDLLLQVMPHIATEKTLALKGGTAINLFLRKMPRLSVDIDLTYLPFDNRETALTNIADSLERIRERIKKSIPEASVNKRALEGNDVKLLVQSRKAQIKIEVNTITRGHLHPARLLQVNDTVQERFKKFAAIQVVSNASLFGGKICAALDRQHPRDLFDVHLLFQEYNPDYILALDNYQLSFDQAFSQVIEHCSSVNRDGQDDTWIGGDPACETGKDPL